jgi:hypothetical protein
MYFRSCLFIDQSYSEQGAFRMAKMHRTHVETMQYGLHLSNLVYLCKQSWLYHETVLVSRNLLPLLRIR